VQLPKFREEGMIRQFLYGLPGVDQKNDTYLINRQGRQFDEEFVRFFEDYISLSEPGADYKTSRFAFTALTGKGVFSFSGPGGPEPRPVCRPQGPGHRASHLLHRGQG
jgi:hypothetical protein